MKRFLRKVVPQRVINNFKHLPDAILANLRYGFPSKKIIVVGVTGTDGKTTTVNMIYQILKTAGKKVSMISTINAVIGEKEFDTGFHVTSPDRMLVQKLIRQAVSEGSEYMVLEVTSNGLDQYRFWGIKFDIGVITNITHEHLDYHKNWENYFIAKSKLIKNSRIAILNRGENHFERLKKIAKGKVVSFGLTKNADFNPSKFPVKLKLPGDFNILNGLAAAAVGVNLNIDVKLIRHALENFQSLNGRMEYIKNDLGIKIIVDFAHTPNALEQALKTLRKETKGKLIAVFGSAGQRDEGKRSMMGEVSAKLADLLIITAEDPRGMIDQINRQIIEGIEKVGGLERLTDDNLIDSKKYYLVENNRQKAIEKAIKIANRGDLIGIFGKGHERSINLDGVKELPWSDKEVVEDILRGKS